MSSNIHHAYRILTEEFRKQNCIVFVGNGILTNEFGNQHESEHTAPYQMILKKLVENHDFISDDMSFNQALSLKSAIEGRRAMISFLMEQLDISSLSSLPIHREIAKLPLSAIITTNWDELIEKELTRARVNFHTIIDDNDIPFLRSENVPILKLRGSLERPNSIIATTDDLIDAFHDRSLIAEMVFFLCARRTILFIGYDLDDTDFMQLYRILHRRLGKFLPLSYALIHPEKPQLTREYWEDYKVQIIKSDATDFLEQLNQRISDWHQKKASESWISDPLMREFLEINRMSTANQVTDSIAKGAIKLLESNLSLEDIDLRIRDVVDETMAQRPNYRGLDSLKNQIIPQWFPPACTTKAESREKVLNFIDQRFDTKKELAREGAKLIHAGDAVLIYSQSTCVLAVLNNYLQRTFPQSEIEIFIAECRPKSPKIFSGAITIVQNIDNFTGKFRLTPDVAIGSLMKAGNITKVLMGAHGIMILPNQEIQVTNTVGTYSICLLAQQFSIPVYFFAEESKVYRHQKMSEKFPTSYQLYAEEILLDKKDPSIINQLEGKGIELENPGFDNVSSSDVKFHVVTESGIIYSSIA